MMDRIQSDRAAAPRMELFSNADQFRREIARLNQGAFSLVEAEDSPRGIIITQGASGIVGPTPKAGFILNAYA